MSKLNEPGARGKLWDDHAPALAEAAARDCLARWRHGSARDITHVVVHSCTGFAAPGLDFHLIKALGLPSSTRKLGVNFMGCFGGMTALYTAKQIVEADKTGKAVVLIACAEVCSAHMTDSAKVELIIGTTLFADGAGAAIVTHAGFRGHPPATFNPPADGRLLQAAGPDAEWALGDMSSEIVPDSADDMTWRQCAVAGQYEMFLARSIAASLARTFTATGISLLHRVGITNPWTCGWAIHPGGKAILTGFEEAFGKLRIKGEGIETSREVLRNYGNMSSATILFVLQRILSTCSRPNIFFAGFGPGLTIEFGRLYQVSADGSASGATAANSSSNSSEEADGEDSTSGRTSQSLSPASASDDEGAGGAGADGLRRRGEAAAAAVRPVVQAALAR